VGTLWEWRPKDGYFTMVDDEDGENHFILLSTVQAAMQPGNRMSLSRQGDEDMLERARREGWAG
jgi:hypothetical protein